MGRKNTPEEQKISDDKRRARDRLRNKTPGRRAQDKKRWTGSRQETNNARRKEKGSIDRPADKLKVMKHYSKQSLGCAFCGEEYIDFLQIHHDEGRKNIPHPKDFDGDHLYNWLINHNFPENLGIQVLCANCNGGGHHNAEYTKTNKTDEKNVSVRSSRKKLKIEIFTEYSKKISNSNKPICACCGVNQINFLSIDHIDGREESEDDYGYDLNRKLKKEFKKTGNWPDNIQILCLNCNHAKGLSKDNKCPHEGN